MARRNESEFVGVKFPTGLLEMIDLDVETSNEFKSRSEWIIAACRQYEEHRTKLLADRAAAKMTNETDYVSTSPGPVDTVSGENRSKIE